MNGAKIAWSIATLRLFMPVHFVCNSVGSSDQRTRIFFSITYDYHTQILFLVSKFQFSITRNIYYKKNLQLFDENFNITKNTLLLTPHQSHRKGGTNYFPSHSFSFQIPIPSSNYPKTETHYWYNTLYKRHYRYIHNTSADPYSQRAENYHNRTTCSVRNHFYIVSSAYSYYSMRKWKSKSNPQWKKWKAGRQAATMTCR